MIIIKNLLYYILNFFVTFGVSISIVFFSIFKAEKICYNIFKFWGKTLFKLTGSDYEFSGLENIDISENYIFCPNHTSAFDIYILSGYLPFKFAWVSKIEYFKVPFVGRAMRALNFVGINRTNPKKAYTSIKQAVEIINKKKLSVIIFPEGTRSLDGKLQKFKRGSLMLAVEAKKKIVPVTISGSYDIQPKNSFFVRKSKVKIHFSIPLNPPTEDKESQLSVLQQIYDEIAANQQKVN